MRFNPNDSWTVRLARELWPYMGPRAIWRFRDFSERERRGALRAGQLLSLGMKFPARQTLHLREVGTDILTFQEVILEQVYRAVVERLPDCRTVIDLGANIGLTTLYLSAHYPGCRFFAVEPNPDTFRVLELNVAGLVRGGRCQTFRGAVWGSRKALAADAARAAERYSSFATVEAEGGGATIDGLPMPELIERAGFERVDLVKADIEGAEVELFSGDLSWLDRVGALAVEFHGDSRAAIGFDALVRDRGFRVVEDGKHTTLAVRARD
jgi:FkbM family methyltransferase